MTYNSDSFLKNWLLRTSYAIALFVLSFLFIGFLLQKIPIPVFLLFIIFAAGAFFALWIYNFILSLKRYKNTKNLKKILRPGMRFGINNGDQNLIVMEWSWFNPNIIIAQNKNGHTLRVHASIVVLYM